MPLAVNEPLPKPIGAGASGGTLPAPPRFGTAQLINDGTSAFADATINNAYLIAYSSIIRPADNIGNISADGTTWTPTANNTDPPSHFLTTVKDFSTDYNTFPTFDIYNNLFAMAWIESNLVGRLNLKYTDIPIGPPIPPIDNVNSPDVYYYPNLQNLKDWQTENIPLSDFTVVDIGNNTYNINAFAIPSNRGYELTMPQPLRAVRFSQSFRQRQLLQGFLGEAIQQGSTVSKPLVNVGITIYNGKTTIIYYRLTTDIDGTFDADMQPGNYTFEIEINTLSINYCQKVT